MTTIPNDDTIRALLETVLDRALPVIEPDTPRSYALRGDDPAVDARNDERFAVDQFIDALLADPTLTVIATAAAAPTTAPATSPVI
ncbi:hypothetical protein [Microbacterium sp. 77mftsu3.1]|uniref:hypothetical protein n=1 Tax=Microbacterium sp. 77mftsu3.1 TaxID=1761802 RepID=UPI000368CF1D|nr:hypothetical protein [Microbacterium sp. 77mftsu3.1]SDH41155.1 hypothetical protein SAMN04488590_3273 [Microbacterium sp. 77mftsu3.1]